MLYRNFFEFFSISQVFNNNMYQKSKFDIKNLNKNQKIRIER